MLLQDICDCVCRKPTYDTWFPYREIHVYKVLYVTVYNKNPPIQLIFFKKKKKRNGKGFWEHYTVNKKSILEEKNYAGGIPLESWSSRTQSPWLQRSPCVRSWVVFLPIHCLLIKRILIPILYCACLMYIGLMNMFNYVINMFFI